MSKSDIYEGSFKMAIEHFEAEGAQQLAYNLIARDTAQREALARVEAENTEIRLAFGGQQMTLDESQAQLAEAVGLLRYAMDSSSFREILSLERDIAAFLSRHAQAEQQEAQGPMAKMAEGLRQKAADEWASHPSNPANQEAPGAQAGDERAAFESNPAFVGMNFSRAEGHPEYYDSPFANGAWEGWQARAALATQPAAGEPVAYCDDFTLGKLKSGLAYRVGVTPAAQRYPDDVHALYVVSPAAMRAQGDRHD